MTDPERRRRRPAVSCTLCRRRKIRCNRESPCNNCVRSRQGTDACVYESFPAQPPRPSTQSSADRSIETSSEHGGSPEFRLQTPLEVQQTVCTPVSSIPSRPKPETGLTVTAQGGVEWMKDRIKTLEEQLLKRIETPRAELTPAASAPTPNSGIETNVSGFGGTIYVHYETRSFDRRPQTITRSVTHKSRMFGQSHWMNTLALARDIVRIVESVMDAPDSKLLRGLNQCKSLARVVKAQRSPEWPVIPSTDLPDREICDQLVDYYLRTTETIFRVLHIPTFRREYESVWTARPESVNGFLIQLKLILALGATSYDAKFSLRGSAIRWIYEAQTWLTDPAKTKSRLGIQALQSNILLLLAREAVCVGQDLIWTQAGMLYRIAIYMGLHRDPVHLPRKTPLCDEMRRRLWNTVLEVLVHTSLTAGGPPLVSLDDFDTEPPRNFDDDQLSLELTEAPEPRPDDVLSQMSVAIALRKTLPLRLAIVKFLNDFNSRGTYDEVLQLDAQFKDAFRTLTRTLQACFAGRDGNAAQAPFETRAVDFIMRRYLVSLHTPFFAIALQDTAYEYSRKVALETSLRIWRAAYPNPAESMARNSIIASAGFPRTVQTYQAACIVGVELKAQLDEHDGLGPPALRPDLLPILEEAKSSGLSFLESGETNVKGCLFIALVSAYIEGAVRGLQVGSPEFTQWVASAAERTLESCLAILEGLAEETRADTATVDLDQSAAMSFGLAGGESMQNWDFVMTDALFDFGNQEPVGWMF